MQTEKLSLSHREYYIKEIVDAFLRIGSIFTLGFLVVFNNFFFSLFTSAPRTNTLLLHTDQDLRVSATKSAVYAQKENSSPQGVMPKYVAGIASVTEKTHTHALNTYLEDRVSQYKTPFSLLPPGKHLRIHRLGIQAPIQDVNYASAEKIDQGHFTEELEQGVVKYPFTAEPGAKGNTLIFGHSSVDYWEGKKNPYGFIFSQLHELQKDDTIEIVWGGKQYIYKVEETVIKQPGEVNTVVEQHTDKNYLILMACYPRFSTAKRILVFAHEIKKK